MVIETIKGNLGKDILIELKSNPTTGYRWCIISAEGLTTNEQFVLDQSKKGMCGVGGIQQFRISSIAPGSYKFKIAYKREWENEEDDIREYTLIFE